MSRTPPLPLPSREWQNQIIFSNKPDHMQRKYQGFSQNEKSDIPKDEKGNEKKKRKQKSNNNLFIYNYLI